MTLGNNYTNLRKILLKATPTPTLTPIAPTNSTIVFLDNFLPLIIAIVPIIDICNPVITGKSAIGTGVAHTNPVTVITLFLIILAKLLCTDFILDNLDK